MLKVTADGLNSILSNLVTESGSMLWITDEAYQKDIYLSPQFKEMMGDYTTIMHEDFRQFLINRLAGINENNRYELIEKKLGQRNEKKPVVTYCVYDKNNVKHYIEDVLLCGFKRRVSHEQLIVGFMREISEEAYYQSLECNQPFPRAGSLELIFNDLIEISTIPQSLEKNILLPTHSNEHLININNTEIKITNREAECLNYLLLGNSSKVIARKLNISPRTVEIHISNIKRKANVMTRLELLVKIKNPEDFCNLEDFCEIA